MKRFEHAENSKRSSWTWKVLGSLLLLVFLAGCAGSGSSGSNTIGIDGPATSPSQQTSKATSTASGTASPSSSSPTIASLESKPLHLPSVGASGTCPISQIRSGVVPGRQYALGNGPVYLVVQNATPTLLYDSAPFIGDTSSGLGGARSIWAVDSHYQGDVLIRGQQLNGNNPLRFNGGLGQVSTNPQGTEPVLNSLALNAQQAQNSSWASFITFTRLQAPGCYGIQVDGQNFSEVIVFQASAA